MSSECVFRWNNKKNITYEIEKSSFCIRVPLKNFISHAYKRFFTVLHQSDVHNNLTSTRVGIGAKFLSDHVSN